MKFRVNKKGIEIMKVGKIILLNLLFILMLSIGVNAAEKYMVDDANVLKQDTINTVEENLSKIEKNTDVIVKLDIIKSLNGKSIDDYAKQYAKDNIKGDQYILFVTSVNDRKNKLLVGSKANNILSQADIEKIASLPNQDYKANNFDAGIIKVGKALDEKVTTKAVKTGKAEVSNNGYSTSVQHKTNYLAGIMVMLIIIIIGVILFVIIRRKINNDYEKRKKKFAQDNNLDSYNDSFHSADVNNKRNGNNGYSSFNNNSANRNSSGNSIRYDNSYTSNGHTTIIHENNNNNFVEGMVIGSILSDSHHDHYYDNDYRREPERRETERSYDNESSTYTSGDWDTGNGTSSWDSSSSEDSNSTSYSDSSSDTSSSSWDSSSDSTSSGDSSNNSSSSDW